MEINLVVVGATATREEFIETFNNFVVDCGACISSANMEIERLKDEITLLQQRLDASAKAYKKLERRLDEISGTPSKADEVKDKILLNVQTNDAVGKVKETLSDYNASLEDKLNAVAVGEELIAKNLITEKQAGMLRKFIDTFKASQKKRKKNQDTPSNDAKEDDIQTSGNKELDDAYNTLVHCLNKCCNLDDKHLRFTDDYKETAIKAVDTHFKIQELLKNGARLPKKQFAYFAQCTAKENGWWKTMMETWTENNDNKTMDGNDGGGEKTTA